MKETKSMGKLELTIFKSLEKFKNKQINLYATVTREMLAEEIAKDIRSEIKKEKEAT